VTASSQERMGVISESGYGLIVDKPAGITSHDVVARVRRLTGIRRVGHAGTLDPFATGVLIICVGRATRLVQFLVGLDKEYVATVRFGFATDTQDLTGKQITPLRSSNELAEVEIERVLGEFVGPQTQVPPMYSAKKVEGQRLYRAARAGLEIERPPQAIEVYSISMDKGGVGRAGNGDGTMDVTVKIRCSSGTYVRTIANDIGARLGVGAHLAALRRTAVGRFSIESAATLTQMEEQSKLAREASGSASGVQLKQGRFFLTPAELVQHLPSVRLLDSDALRIRNGQAIGLDAEGGRAAVGADKPLDLVGLLGPEGSLIGIGAYSQNKGVIEPRVVLDTGDSGGTAPGASERKRQGALGDPGDSEDRG